MVVHLGHMNFLTDRDYDIFLTPTFFAYIDQHQNDSIAEGCFNAINDLDGGFMPNCSLYGNPSLLLHKDYDF